MEISDFLLKEQTLALRKSFVENFRQKQLQLLEWMHTLEREALPEEEAIPLTSQLFNEIHRFKGTGGTYGFNEISVVCREILRFIRPPFNEKRRPFPHELKEALILQEKLHRYTPVIEKGLNALSQMNSPISCIILIDPVRGPFADELDFFTIEEQCLVISTFNPQDVFSIKKHLSPRSILLHAPYADCSTPQVVQKLGESFSCSLILSGDPKLYEEVDDYGKLSLSSVTPYTSDRGSVQALMRKALQ